MALALEKETIDFVLEKVFSSGPGPKVPPERYRFYACELKWNAWHCTPTQEKIWNPKPDTLATQLIPVNKWVPNMLDPAVISYKLKKPVLIKKD